MMNDPKDDSDRMMPRSEEKPKLFLPSYNLILPATPHQQRMINLSVPIPPEHSPEGRYLKRKMEQDIAFQRMLKDFSKILPHILIARANDGSGLQMSNLLRDYFFEYNNRLLEHGPDSMPSSFNIVEAFVTLERDFLRFDLRPESEHLLSLDDYLKWYESSNISKYPSAIIDIIPEGIIHSYDMVGISAGPMILGESKQVIAGASIVRHKDELSVILLAGEDKPFFGDDATGESDFVTPGREAISANPTLTREASKLETYPECTKVIILGRINLRTAQYDARYINVDYGPGFAVATDDLELFETIPAEHRQTHIELSMERLAHYREMFSLMTSLIFTPAYFIEHTSQVDESQFLTEFGVKPQAGHLKESIKIIGKDKCQKNRLIKWIPIHIPRNDKYESAYNPPPLEAKQSGYWRKLHANEIGEDEEGNAIVGKTWVARHETWVATSPTAFVLLRTETSIEGPDPGTIYVQRSPSHGPDVYKIGLTRRTPVERARELSSSTSTPLPFEVICSWEVGDCANIEKAIHDRLKQYRINPRREFFRIDLQHINKTVSKILNDIETN